MLVVYINGLNPIIFIEWASLKGLCRDNSAIDHIRFVLHDLENNQLKYNKYYSYSVMNDRYETVNGLPKK